MRFLRVLAIAVVCAAALTASTSNVRAYAYDSSCNVLEAVQVGDFSGTGWIIHHGTKLTTTPRSRDMNSTCHSLTYNFNPVVGTFAKVKFVDSSGNPTGYYVAMGYWEGQLPNGAEAVRGAAMWKLAGYIDPTIMTLPGGAVSYGTSCDFRIYKSGSSGSTYFWRPEANCGSGWQDPLSGGGSISTPYSGGYSITTTERYGGTSTGMSDNVSSLKFFSSSGAWDTWNDLNCFSDTASNWFPYIASSIATGYNVNKGSPTC
jgi:hypothetical protein